VPLTAILAAWLEGHPRSRRSPSETFSPGCRSRGNSASYSPISTAGFGNVLIWLPGLHAVAALYHHFWRRDTVLLWMLPGR
jgi:cytochrome b561